MRASELPRPVNNAKGAKVREGFLGARIRRATVTRAVTPQKNTNVSRRSGTAPELETRTARRLPAGTRVALYSRLRMARVRRALQESQSAGHEAERGRRTRRAERVPREHDLRSLSLDTAQRAIRARPGGHRTNRRCKLDECLRCTLFFWLSTPAAQWPNLTTTRDVVCFSGSRVATELAGRRSRQRLRWPARVGSTRDGCEPEGWPFNISGKTKGARNGI